MFEINACEIKNGHNQMNFEKVTRMLCQAFWCEGIRIPIPH
jgi:hypothetical protein